MNGDADAYQMRNEVDWDDLVDTTPAQPRRIQRRSGVRVYRWRMERLRVRARADPMHAGRRTRAEGMEALVTEMHVREELLNIVRNAPLWPGDTISHAGANECGRRGWAKRDDNGHWIPTPEGIAESLRTHAEHHGGEKH